MPASPGADRAHNDAGADPAVVAEFAATNYTELRRRSERHAGADKRIPLDPLAELRRKSPNPNS